MKRNNRVVLITVVLEFCIVMLLTVNVDIFAQYLFLRISWKTLDLRKYDVSENLYYYRSNTIFFFPPTGLVRLYIASLPLRSCRTIGAPSVQGSVQCAFFSFLLYVRKFAHAKMLNRD